MRVECPFAKSEEGGLLRTHPQNAIDYVHAKWFIYAHPSCADIVVIIC